MHRGFLLWLPAAALLPKRQAHGLYQLFFVVIQFAAKLAVPHYLFLTPALKRGMADAEKLQHFLGVYPFAVEIIVTHRVSFMFRKLNTAGNKKYRITTVFFVGCCNRLQRPAGFTYCTNFEFTGL